MPVGRGKISDFDASLPKKFIDLLDKEILNKSSNVKYGLHCSLRVMKDNIPNNYCNMLLEKIGIDNLGNVFAALGRLI